MPKVTTNGLIFWPEAQTWRHLFCLSGHDGVQNWTLQKVEQLDNSVCVGWCIAMTYFSGCWFEEEWTGDIFVG